MRNLKSFSFFNLKNSWATKWHIPVSPVPGGPGGKTASLKSARLHSKTPSQKTIWKKVRPSVFYSRPIKRFQSREIKQKKQHKCRHDAAFL